MITYEPLMATMRRKGVSFPELLERLGTDSGQLKRSLNTGKYIALSTVDRICSALRCDVKDVLSWKEGEQTVREVRLHCTVDWDRLDEMMLSRNMDPKEVSVAMGKSRTWYSTARRQPHILKSNMRALAGVLNIECDDYILEEHR